MANLKVIAAQRARARETLHGWTESSLALRRRVYFVPGFTDEDGFSCWGDDVLDKFCFATEVPELCENPGLATFVSFEADGAPPHYEDFIRFGAHLARLVQQDRAAVTAALYRLYQAAGNTHAALYNGVAQRDWFETRARRYPSTLAAALHGNNIPESVVETLIQNTHAGTEPLQRYHRLRRRGAKPRCHPNAGRWC